MTHIQLHFLNICLEIIVLMLINRNCLIDNFAEVYYRPL